MKSLSTQQIRQIESARKHAQDRAEINRNSDIARIANELQAGAPGLTRTDALKLAESAVPFTI